MAITWNTQAGFLANVEKGSPFQYSLLCSNANSFSVIAGSLPIGLSLTGPFNQPTQPFPSIYGNVSVDAVSGSSLFTIRASDLNGNIADRAFNLNVEDQEPSYIFPTANLGIYPDGKWAFATVAPVESLPNWLTYMTVVSGSLPNNLTLDPLTGNITGIINPSTLYTGLRNQPNDQSGSPELPLSVNSKVYSFTVQYDAENTANFNMTVERQDLYNIGHANSALPVYHDPIFIDATYGNSVQSSNLANVNLGVIDGDNIYYQFETFDYEYNSVGYALINGNVIPGKVSLNANTGWLTGYIDRDLSSPIPYQFQVVAYKNANVFGNAYQTTAYCNLTIQNPLDNNIMWNSPSDLGNLFPGIPSSLNVKASVIETFSTPAVNPAIANCTMKLVNVLISNGGNAFANGSVFTVPDGISENSANIIVSNVSPTGTITSVIIDPTIVQRYTELPPGFSVVWANDTGNANALNAIFDLSFGVDEVTILKSGNNYDTATVGFGPAGEANSAMGSTLIFNGTIQNVVVNESGDGYLGIPSVVINAKELVTPTNPINYSLSSGNIPAGCEFLSNGLMVGIPSFEYLTLDGNTSAPTEFQFTVNAAIGRNTPINFTETDLSGNNNVVTEDFQTLIVVNKPFTLSLQSSTQNNMSAAPRTNLSLEFLLDDIDMNTIFAPILDQTIVPNGDIYRQADFYFGIVPNVRMLLAYGISPELPNNIQFAISQYFQNKQYSFNKLCWAQSTSEGYEVIYVIPQDEFTNANGETFSGSITYSTPTGQKIAFPATLPNMINQLNTHLNGFDYNYLPSWMRDIQPNGQILGFIPAIPLIYVQPGTGQRILFYLQQYYNSIGRNIANVCAITDRLIWNAGVQENWNPAPTVSISVVANIANVTANSSFIINPAIPSTFTPNLVPRTYTFFGNVTVNLTSGMTNIANVSTIINDLNINGIESLITANNALEIKNTYGCPFLLYDGTNTPLENLGILSSGNAFANVNTVTSAGWTSYNDGFLNDDDGALYIKFEDSYFINTPTVTV